MMQLSAHADWEETRLGASRLAAWHGAPGWETPTDRGSCTAPALRSCAAYETSVRRSGPT